jgi:hypothetical protein
LEVVLITRTAVNTRANNATSIPHSAFEFVAIHEGVCY